MARVGGKGGGAAVNLHWSIDYWQEGVLGSVIQGGEGVVFEKKKRERSLWGGFDNILETTL